MKWRYTSRERENQQIAQQKETRINWKQGTLSVSDHWADWPEGALFTVFPYTPQLDHRTSSVAMEHVL